MEKLAARSHFLTTKATSSTHLFATHHGADNRYILFFPAYRNTILDKAELEDKAQSEVVVAIVGRVVVPIRHTAVPGIVVPTATTVHAVRASTDALLW